jgi:hypothetical protein
VFLWADEEKFLERDPRTVDGKDIRLGVEAFRIDVSKKISLPPGI